MRYLPIFMAVRRRPCLVVGGGSAAAAKVSLLLRAGARVTVVAPTLGAPLAELARHGEVRAAHRPFEAEDVRGNAVVICATGLGDVDAAVSEAARAAGIAVNVVDRPALSSFVMPAFVDRDPVMVAISSGGAAPALARRVRQSIEILLPSGLGRLARFAESFRASVGANIADRAGRRRFWDTLFEGPVAEAVLRGEEHLARGTMLELINRPDRGGRGQGMVHLVGAGPGDADLLTLRALRLLQQADVVIHDERVGPEILDRARRDADLVRVGEAEIDDLIVRLAHEGRRVVRLKEGDGGGEELERLRARGVQVEVVPGIAAAYPPLPLAAGRRRAS
jgi:uroporphyrin-III C-methyltransferase/precorrin-2 dehydrogenase/sirohydrochlorin ferrochelatase